MDPLQILSIVAKGVSLVSHLVAPGGVIEKGGQLAETVLAPGGALQSALGAIRRLTDKDPEDVTEDELNTSEAELDALLTEFNAPMPGRE